MSHRGKHSTSRHSKGALDPEVATAGHAEAELHGFPAEHRAGLLPEKYFRWRAGEITRLEAFCDVVFGFAITLLVVSLEVPRSFAELIAAMRGFLPFAVCFAQLVMIWREHYRFSRRYGLEDPYTAFLNVVLLFLVLFYVYPLKFVFSVLSAQLFGTGPSVDMTRHEGSVLMMIYGFGFAAVFFLFALMYRHAYRLRGAIGLGPVEVLETRNSIQSNTILTGVGLASFLVALRHPEYAGWVYFLIGPLLAINGTIMGKRVRLLAEATQGK